MHSARRWKAWASRSFASAIAPRPPPDRHTVPDRTRGGIKANSSALRARRVAVLSRITLAQWSGTCAAAGDASPAARMATNANRLMSRTPEIASACPQSPPTACTHSQPRRSRLGGCVFRPDVLAPHPWNRSWPRDATERRRTHSLRVKLSCHRRCSRSFQSLSPHGRSPVAPVWLTLRRPSPRRAHGLRPGMRHERRCSIERRFHNGAFDAVESANHVGIPRLHMTKINV